MTSDKHYILTTAGQFEISEESAAEARTEFDSDSPDPHISFTTLEEPPRFVEVMYDHVIGFATAHAPRSIAKA